MGRRGPHAKHMPEPQPLTIHQLRWCIKSEALVFRPHILNKIMQQMGMRRLDLAKMMHVSAVTVSRWLTGTRSPSPHQIAQMQEVFPKLQAHFRNIEPRKPRNPQKPRADKGKPRGPKKTASVAGLQTKSSPSSKSKLRHRTSANT